MTTAAPDPPVVALARGVERLTRQVGELAPAARRVGELETLVQQLAADVTALVRATPAAADGGALVRVRSWLLADDPVRAAADLADLTAWLGSVYLRFPDATLPSCWLWHPAVVEELFWLRHAHADAYDPGGGWPLVADWHDRHRPGVAARIRKAVDGCELALHAPGREQAAPAPGVPQAAAADRIAQAWTIHGRTPPAPTEQQLTEADTHDRAAHRTRR